MFKTKAKFCLANFLKDDVQDLLTTVHEKNDFKLHAPSAIFRERLVINRNLFPNLLQSCQKPPVGARFSYLHLTLKAAFREENLILNLEVLELVLLETSCLGEHLLCRSVGR